MTGPRPLPGDTDEDPARSDSPIDDLAERVFGVRADSTRVRPGPGGDTTVGAGRPSVPGGRARGR